MRAFHIGLTLCVLPGLLLAAGGPKRQQRPADQKKYQNFSTHLSQDGQYRHALARWTFGARRGDLDAIKSIGLKTWINGELHPEKTPENAELTARLAPF